MPSSDPSAATAPALQPPRSASEIFFTFNRLALQGFGGVLAVAQRELVERRRWMGREEFLEYLSVGQVLPGPNVVNLALMIGDRYHGPRGAFAALAGMLTVPLLIVLALVALYGHYAQHAMVAGALRGMGAVAAGLIVATALKLMGSFRSNPLGRLLCGAFAALAFIAVALLHWPLAGVIAVLGPLSMACAWWALGREGR